MPGKPPRLPTPRELFKTWYWGLSYSGSVPYLTEREPPKLVRIEDSAYPVSMELYLAGVCLEAALWEQREMLILPEVELTR